MYTRPEAESAVVWYLPADACTILSFSTEKDPPPRIIPEAAFASAFASAFAFAFAFASASRGEEAHSLENVGPPAPPELPRVVHRG